MYEPNLNRNLAPMKKLLLILIFSIASGLSYRAMAWDGIGHKVIVGIAERNLTPRAKANLEKYIDHTIVEYSTWMDEYRTAPGYEMTTWWHMGTIDENGNPCGTIRDNGDGDALPQLVKAIDRLKNMSELSDSTVNINIKYVLHIVADMHCPAHIFFSDLPGGPQNRYGWFRLTFNGNQMAYHGLWDSSLRHGYPEWKGDLDTYCENFDTFSAEEKLALSAGSPEDWLRESGRECHVIYDWAKPGDVITSEFFIAHRDLAKMQAVKAGYRLARVLNELFGK